MNKEVEEHINLLESKKVTDRRRACEYFLHSLNDFDVVKYLNKSHSWNGLFLAVQACLYKDAEKMLESMKKRGNDVAKNISADVFVMVIKYGLQDKSSLDVHKVVGYIVGCLKTDNMKKCYERSFLLSLKNSVLFEQYNRSQLVADEWQALFQIIKEYCERTTLTDSEIDKLYINFLKYFIKFAPQCGLPIEQYRQEITFLISLIQKVHKKLPKVIHEDIVEIATDFCLNCAKDCRYSCCDLGEQTFPNLLELYGVNCGEDQLKVKLINYFLLQTTIHHPNGALESHENSSAKNWQNWYKYLAKIYWILLKEIDFYHHNSFKNALIFVPDNKYTFLLDNFKVLYVEVAHQLYSVLENNSINITQSSTSTLFDLQPAKKIRLEDISFRNLVDNVEHSTEWVWLSIFTSMISKYPTLLETDDFLRILRVLSTLIVDSQDVNLKMHAYECLAVLEAIDKSTDETWNIWKKIAKFAVLSLNQINTRGIHLLLQSLILRQNIVDVDLVLQNMLSSSLGSEFGVRTVLTLVSEAHFTTGNHDRQIKVAEWLLNEQESHFWLQNDSVLMIGGLCFKQWPVKLQSQRIKPLTAYDDIIDSYTNKFYAILPDEDNKSEMLSKELVIDEMLLEKLLVVLQERYQTIRSVQNTLNFCNFLLELMDFFITYQVSIESGPYADLLENILQKLEQEFVADKKRHNKTDFICYMKGFQRLFSKKKNKFLTELVTKNIDTSLLSEFFSHLNDIQEAKSVAPNPQLLEARQELIKVLSIYGLVSGSENLDDNQLHVLELLLDPSYDFQDDYDYKMVLSIISQLDGATNGIVNNSIADNIVKLFISICNTKYLVYDYAIDILTTLKCYYKHLVNLSNEIKEMSLSLLSPFYCSVGTFGPEVAIKILDCIQITCKIDPKVEFSKWEDGQELISLVPEFFLSDYVQVRLKAIETFVIFFVESSKSDDLRDFHRQELLFHKMYESAVSLLEKQCSADYSVLLLYYQLMVSCNHWVEDCVLAVMKLIHNCQLKQVDGLIREICRKFGKSFLDHHVENLLEKWLSEGYKIDNLPFDFFGCPGKKEFYSKYLEICVPLLFSVDRKDLVLFSGISEKPLIEKAIPKLLVREINTHLDNLSISTIDHSKSMQELHKFWSKTDLNSICENHLDVIILGVIHHKQLKKILDFLHLYLDFDIDFMPYVLQHGCKALERTLMALKLNIHNSISTKDRHKKFEQYKVMVDLICQNISKNSEFAPFFIRDLSYFTMNLAKNKPDLNLAILTYFNSLLVDLLPKFGHIFESFIPMIVNSLRNILLINDGIALNIIELIIQDNIIQSSGVLTKLDPFPEDDKFSRINGILDHIKFKDKPFSLEDEINHFLDLSADDSIAYRESSLKLLLQKLQNGKSELIELQKMSGAEENLLHRLVIRLVKCLGAEKAVSCGALRCLGELGPFNLRTLTLQGPKPVDDKVQTPFEMLCQITVDLLTNYIIDLDVYLVEASTEVLHAVMLSKEARKVTNDKDFLKPFIIKNAPNTSTNVGINNDLFISLMNNSEIWCPTNLISHQTWITNLVCQLLSVFNDSSFLAKLVPVCKLKVEMCEKLLPILLYMMLFNKNATVVDLISAHVDSFFEQHWDRFVKNVGNDGIVSDKSAVRCMLNVVDFVRVQKALHNSKRVNDLKLNYLKVAQACEFCEDHFSALLYAETWCYETLDILEKKKGYQPLPAGYTKHDLIYEHVDAQTAKAMHQIFRRAYKSIGDSDALVGCGISFILEPEFQVEYYKDTNQWDRVAYFYDMQGDSVARSDLPESLKMCSLSESSLLCSDNLSNPQYECMWRLGQWKLEEEIRHAVAPTADVNKFKYYMLKSINDEDEYNFERFSRLQAELLIGQLKGVNLECSRAIYPLLSEVLSHVDASDFINSGDFEEKLEKWQQQEPLLESNDIQYVEPVMAQRLVIAKIYLTKHMDQDNSGVVAKLAKIMLRFTDLARNEGQHRVAARIIKQLQNIPDLEDTVKADIELSQAQLCWTLNDQLTAKHVLNKLGRNENGDALIRATALKLSGQYMAETYSENRQTIISDYFLKSLGILGSAPNNREAYENRVDVFDKLASFADREYQQIVNHIKSDVFEKKVSNMKRSRETASLIRDKRHITDDERKAAAIHERQSKIDHAEIENTKTQRDNFLQLGLKYYLKSLQLTDKNNIRVFRMISMFMENRNNDVIKNIIKSYLNLVPTYKFIDMLPQLVPHISESNADLFASEMFGLVEKCAIDHPHHTIPLLLALANANIDRDFTKSQTVTSSNDARTAAAIKLLAKVKSLKDLVNRMNALSVALIELAYYEVADRNSRKKEVAIPSNLKIRKIQRFDNVLIPTISIPVSKTKNYENIVGIHSYKTNFQNVGGINAPKCISCRGTDGVYRPQLVKGKDDLRQDSVMQQVFTIMNNLLGSNKKTQDLRIRTYKIVPLSMRSGILEWVEDSMPIGEYLIGDDKGNLGAHRTYRPGDLKPSDCRTQFRKGEGQSAETKLTIFSAICKRFQPVFHKFFVEHFLHPTVWYERRRAYTFSVATTSMCGYVLGIGDRHVSNILIDKKTAEIIHIDFGIAFEQGRCLPTPETIPFRLSRDIVDGMGVSGVEGMFKRSCVKTMEVLRENSQTILSIVEVLLYDPLYYWSVTPTEANKRQTDDDDDEQNSNLSMESENSPTNTGAERALLRLRQKLQGTEEGAQTSVQHQVGTLIQQAMDPYNLCRLFYGWQPYL